MFDMTIHDHQEVQRGRFRSNNRSRKPVQGTVKQKLTHKVAAPYFSVYGQDCKSLVL